MYFLKFWKKDLITKILKIANELRRDVGICIKFSTHKYKKLILYTISTLLKLSSLNSACIIKILEYLCKHFCTPLLMSKATAVKPASPRTA